MTTIDAPASANRPHNPLIDTARRLIAALERVSCDTLVATPARLFIAVTFWLSGRTKVDDVLTISASTYYLFEYEYSLPIVSSRLAAHLAVYAEHLFPLLLIAGLASRLSAAALLLMTLVIQAFVYPGAWATHLLWASALAFVVFRGPGQLAVDHWLRKRYLP